MIIGHCNLYEQHDKVQLIHFSFSFLHRNNIETFKITHEYDRWHLHLLDKTVKTFHNLIELAKNIKTQSKQKLRLAPSENGMTHNSNGRIKIEIPNNHVLSFPFPDKSTSLQLCLPPHQITAKQSIDEHSENELRKKRAQLFDPIKDFRKYQSECLVFFWNTNFMFCFTRIEKIIINVIRFNSFDTDSQKIIENGIITQMRAEWILPEDKKLDVTLKILRSEKHLPVSTLQLGLRPFPRKNALIYCRMFDPKIISGIHAIGRKMEQFVFAGVH